MRLRIFLGVMSACAAAPLLAQKVAAGPMLGSNTMREVKVWLQTDEPCDVKLRFWPQGTKQPAQSTASVRTSTEDAHVAQFTCSLLEPGTAYDYEVVLNGKAQKLEVPTTFTTLPLYQFRTDPPKFTVALGSCVYINEPEFDRPGKGYGQDPSIFNVIADQAPDAMLWMGDNTYYREVDWDTRSGMLYRQSHTRQTPELQRLLATSHNYAIWDDHDYGPNDSNRSWTNKDISKDVFELFWANASYGNSELPGITSYFTYNDVAFFMLDNRWDRTHPELEGQQQQCLGQDQIDWLIHALKTSNASFKLVVVGGQVLSDYAAYENLARYPEERQQIIDLIAANNIKGVVFLSGDRHSTELTRMDLGGGVIVHDLTCSPLTSTAYDHSEEPNTLRVSGTHVGTQNFGLLTFEGPWKARTMTISIRDASGREQWTATLSRKGELVKPVTRTATTPEAVGPGKLQGVKK